MSTIHPAGHVNFLKENIGDIVILINQRREAMQFCNVGALFRTCSSIKETRQEKDFYINCKWIMTISSWYNPSNWIISKI